MADRISDPWGERTPYGAGEEWPCASTSTCPPASPSETELQLKWLRTRMKQAAPQALVVA